MYCVFKKHINQVQNLCDLTFYFLSNQNFVVMKVNYQFYFHYIYIILLLQAIKEYMKAALEIATTLFKSPDPPVSYIGRVWLK